MSPSSEIEDVTVSLDQHIAIVEFGRPPHNFFDTELVFRLADEIEALDREPDCRAIVLCSQGQSFCAGADLSRATRQAPSSAQEPHADAINPIYIQALRLFSCTKPIVAAIHGPAIGGGLGLALVADFRVSCPEARFSANFNRLGVHPGFVLTFTLPHLLGQQNATRLFYTGRRIGGEEASALGLVDLLVSQDQVRMAAIELAGEIALSAPFAVQSTRNTLRQGMLEQIRHAVTRESAEQYWQFKTADFKEGVAAMAARRPPNFTRS